MTFYFISDWVKIQFDEDDEIMYFHFIPNANNNGLQTINLPRRQETRSTAYVGLLIYKCKLNDDIIFHLKRQTVA